MSNDSCSYRTVDDLNEYSEIFDVACSLYLATLTDGMIQYENVRVFN